MTESDWRHLYTPEPGETVRVLSDGMLLITHPERGRMLLDLQTGMKLPLTMREMRRQHAKKAEAITADSLERIRQAVNRR